MSYDLIELYRAELRSMEYFRMSNAEAAQAKWDYDQAAHSGRIEGLERPPEMQALFDLVVEERLPQDLAERFFDRYAEDRFLKHSNSATCGG